jgi:hypothetical protein
MLTKITLALGFLFAVIQPFRRPLVLRPAGPARFSTTARAPRSAPTVTKSSGARSVLLHWKMAGPVPAIFSVGGISQYAIGR